MRLRPIVTGVACAALISAVLSAPANAAPAATRLPSITYTTINGASLTLTPWQGTHVTLLVEPAIARNATVMTNIVSRLDAAWSYYASSTGRLPNSLHSLNGRDEIAEVPNGSTCGAGCSYLGSTGIEIMHDYFELLYTGVATHNQYDQVLFYELGRNFWFWSPQLAFKAPDTDPVVTGFAVWMRFRSMKAAKVQGAPFNGTPFTTFQSQDAQLVGQYEANTALTFASTLAVDKSPGLYSGNDFWTSMMMQLAYRHGGQTFVSRFWRYASTEPAVTNTAGAVTNWLHAANYASCVNLSSVFYSLWGLPHPDGTVSARLPASAVPEPVGHC